MPVLQLVSNAHSDEAHCFAATFQTTIAKLSPKRTLTSALHILLLPGRFLSETCDGL